MSRNFFKKFINASELQPISLPLDGELLYSKNNVCLHPSGLLSNSILHHSGFLVVTAQVKKGCVSLLFNWSPSIRLINMCDEKVTAPDSKKRHIIKYNFQNKEILQLSESSHDSDLLEDHNVEETAPTSSGTTNVIDEQPIDAAYSAYYSSSASKDLQCFRDEKISENLNGGCVEESTKKVAARPKQNQAFGPFSIDLGLMRSIRIYFRNKICTSGEIVVASHDSLYKILHFHHGGLDGLYSVLKEWQFISMRSNLQLHDTIIKHFSAVYPDLSPGELHPEEGLYQKLTGNTWSVNVDEFGRIENVHNLQKAVFFAGVEKELRPAVWPFLLKFYSFSSTLLERSELQQKKFIKYNQIDAERSEIFSANTGNIENIWKNIACSIEKDVLRTDRANPFFKGEGNPNLSVLQRILLNYAVFTKTSYTQGMSDLLSPILIEIKEESNVFWCFVGLMQQTIFISSPSDVEMEKQLFYLTELIQLLLPEFYSHLLVCGNGAMELLFAHRWILLCFKREFSENEALVVWEACWSPYQTNHFHLFVCVAIISLYGVDVVERKLAADEILLHFSHLALQMNGMLVLKKARSLLHSVRTSDAVPCTLHDLFYVLQQDGSLNHDDMPVIICAKTQHCIHGCLHGGKEKVSEMSKFNIRKMLHRS